MGYPFTKGTVCDGILVCHWHHWQFDLKSGACFVGGGDDVRTFPVEVKQGDVFVGISDDGSGAARDSMIDRGQRILERGLKDASPFLIAKAVVALSESGLSHLEIIRQGLVYGAGKTMDGWSSGVTILTLAGNLWDETAVKDHHLFLTHGLAQIGRKTSFRSSRPRIEPFPGRNAVDVPTLKRWFRRFITQRDIAAAERILVTLVDRGCGKEVIADFLFTAATDFYFTGDGHALDFANKTLEALDWVGWDNAPSLLRPIVVDLATRARHEEESLWAPSVSLLNEVFSRLDEIWAENQENEAGLNITSFAHDLVGRDFQETVPLVEETLRSGVDPRQLCRALTYAGALRVVRFHLKNEGDWHAVANLYSYAHALYQAFQVAPSRDLLRGIFHGVVYANLIRFLNMPEAQVPAPSDGLKDRFSGPKAMLNRLQELADFQKVQEAELLVNHYVRDGNDMGALWRGLTHILLREDAELHMFQVLEAALRHFDLADDAEEKRIHLLAATRYITAQKVMKAILWSTENAEKLQRGEMLSDRQDED